MAGESRTTTDTMRSGVGWRSAGILRIRFPGVGDDQNLEDIDWDAFFEKFEESRLAFLYQDKTKKGETSRFFKFVRR
jgi:hypothetical protein